MILGMGYAGAFAIWAGTRQHLSPPQIILIALGLCASLICYVAFEVYQTIYQVIIIGRFNDVVNSEPQKIGEALQEFQKRNAKSSKRMMQFWGLTTVLAIAFAVSALIILFYAFLANLALTADLPAGGPVLMTLAYTRPTEGAPPLRSSQGRVRCCRYHGLFMPGGLHRTYGAHRMHFITCSSYRRLPFLRSARDRVIASS